MEHRVAELRAELERQGSRSTSAGAARSRSTGSEGCPSRRFGASGSAATRATCSSRRRTTAGRSGSPSGCSRSGGRDHAGARAPGAERRRAGEPGRARPLVEPGARAGHGGVGRRTHRQRSSRAAAAQAHRADGLAHVLASDAHTLGRSAGPGCGRGRGRRRRGPGPLADPRDVPMAIVTDAPIPRRPDVAAGAGSGSLGA